MDLSEIIRQQASLFLLVPFHHSFLGISTLCLTILIMIFLLLNTIECPRLENYMFLCSRFNMLSGRKFVVGVVAVGEIKRAPLPSVPKASVAWTSVCINEICHLHCVGFCISVGSRAGNPKAEPISHIMPLCALSCVTQRPHPPEHLWPLP